MTLGSKLRYLRNLRGLTLQEVADHFKIGKTTLSNYERGERDPGYKMIAKFCEFYNVTSDYMLGITDDPELVRIEGDDLPEELRKIGIEYLDVFKEAKDKNWTPEKIKKIIEAFEE